MQEAETLVLQRHIQPLQPVLTAALQGSHGSGAIADTPQASIEVNVTVTEDVSAATAAETPSGNSSPAVTANDHLRVPDMDQAASDQADLALELGDDYLRVPADMDQLAASDQATLALELEDENRRLKKSVCWLKSAHRLVLDELDQARSDIARARRHQDLIVGIELHKVNPRIHGYSNGQVHFIKPLETTAEKYRKIFGTDQPVGPGPYKGSWVNWGQPFKAPEHAQVRASM